MRTQALRVSIGAYSNGSWHVAIIEDHYERGVLVNSSIESLSHPETEAQLRWNVKRAVDDIIRWERERLDQLGAGSPGPDARPQHPESLPTTMPG